MTSTVLIVAAVVICIPVVLYSGWFVHCVSDRICLRHARAFCRRSGFDIGRARWQPAFEPSGVKTESSLIQVDCIDSHQQRRLILLLVWPFGFRKLVSNEAYPETYDEQWPQQCV